MKQMNEHLWWERGKKGRNLGGPEEGCPTGSGPAKVSVARKAVRGGRERAIRTTQSTPPHTNPTQIWTTNTHTNTHTNPPPLPPSPSSPTTTHTNTNTNTHTHQHTFGLAGFSPSGLIRSGPNLVIAQSTLLPPPLTLLFFLPFFLSPLLFFYFCMFSFFFPFFLLPLDVFGHHRSACVVARVLGRGMCFVRGA